MLARTEHEPPYEWIVRCVAKDYHIAPDEALHLLGWARKRHAPIPCLLLTRMTEYALFSQAHDGYEATLGLPDKDSRVAAERRFRTDCPLANDYMSLIRSPEGQAWLDARLR